VFFDCEYLLRKLLQVLTLIFLQNQANAPQVGPYSLENLILSTDSVLFKQGSDWRGPQQVSILAFKSVTQYLSPGLRNYSWFNS